VCAILALVVIGGIAYVQFIYLPQMAAQSNNLAQPTSTPTMASQPTANPSSTASTAIVPMAGSPTGPSECGTSLSCFEIAATTCSPADVTFSALGTTAQLKISGLNSGNKCLFAEQTDGMNLSCEFTTSYVSQMISRWQAGNLSSNDLTSLNCSATDASGKSIQLNSGGSNAIVPSSQPTPQQVPSGNSSGSASPSTAIPPSGVGTVTVYLYSNEDSVTNGLEFKVNSLTASQLNVTVTDHATGASQAASLTPDNPMTVAGHDIMVTSIQQASNGTVNGQPVYSEEAVLSYK